MEATQESLHGTKYIGAMEYITYIRIYWYGGNNVWRIARKGRKLHAIGGYTFGGCGTIATPSLGVYVVGAILVLAV